MNEDDIKKKKALKSIRILPWFIGLSDDLMFYIAISTLFLSITKGLTASQITFLTTISALGYIILQRPFLYITKKIGNTYSIRIGVIMLLVGGILLTYGNSYSILMIGHIIYMVSFLFKTMDSVMLKNNLIYIKKEDSFIKIRNKAQIIYSVITLVIAIIGGHLFNINNYLPMYLCITVCIINVLLSFQLCDVGDKDKNLEKKEETIKVTFSKVVFFIILSYGILYSIISVGQQNSRLFIQYQLQKYFGTVITATYLSYIVAASRVARVLGNMSFRKIYTKWKDKMNLLLPLVGMLAFAMIALGSFLPSRQVKFMIMAIGFCLILAIRDVFSTYIQDLLLKKTKLSEQQKAVSYFGLSRRVGEALLSFLFSIMLIKLDLFYVVIALIIFCIVSFRINWKLYQMILPEILEKKKGETSYAN